MRVIFEIRNVTHHENKNQAPSMKYIRNGLVMKKYFTYVSNLQQKRQINYKYAIVFHIMLF